MMASGCHKKASVNKLWNKSLRLQILCRTNKSNVCVYSSDGHLESQVAFTKYLYCYLIWHQVNLHNLWIELFGISRGFPDEWIHSRRALTCFERWKFTDVQFKYENDFIFSWMDRWRHVRKWLCDLRRPPVKSAHPCNRPLIKTSLLIRIKGLIV